MSTARCHRRCWRVPERGTEVLGSSPVMESVVVVMPWRPAVQALSLDFLYCRS